MDRNAYQSELDQVQFTEAGRSALTDALMAEQAGPPGRARGFRKEKSRPDRRSSTGACG